MADFTHSLALVIGIDAYDHGIPRLTTAVNDAARLAELLRAEHGYETILLTEPAIGQQVTRERLHTLFTKELKARLGEDDRLLVYFAGHGVALDGDDGPHGYLVPQDARPGDSVNMLAMTDLHAWLTALPCRHMLAILDCCFAGAFRWSATRDLGALPDVIHKERYDRYLLSPAWQVLTSAAYDQKALDVLAGDAKRGTLAGGRGQHSPFALALFDALAGAGDVVPTQQGDGVITATELYMYLRERVEVQAESQANHEQTPGLWPLNKHRKGEFIFLAPGHPLNLPPAPDLTEDANPYRGLKSYDQKHAQLFFGREDEIKELAALVDKEPFVAVLGASGTGKSSLVKAGVLARLQPNPPPPFPPREGGARDGLRDQFHDFEILSPPGGRGAASSELPSPPGGRGVASSELPSPPGGRGVAFSELPSPPGGGVGGGVSFAYHVLPPIRPTDQPVRALDSLLRAELGGDPGGLEDSDDALAQVVARWAATHPDQRLVLTIDQFEELATLCRDDAERERFQRLLATAVRKQPDAFRLIITLRTDFEPQFTQKGSPLAEAWGQGRYIVPPMDIEDLRQVIEGPASVRVLYFDPPELVDDLIKEVIQTPGALPLLSFTLSELYVKYVRSGRDDRALSGADYKALGGVVGSLRNRATEEYDRLPDNAHRATMQRVMLRMVAVEGGGELARRRVALSELDYPTPEENERVKTVIDRLVDARLLVRGTTEVPDGTKSEAYVEPAHDALVLAWDKLLRWKKEAEEYLPLQRRLAQAAGEWSKAAPEARSGLLWDDDPRLPQVEETLWPTGGKRKGLRGRIRWAKQVLAPRTDAPSDTKWLNGVELRFSQVSISRRASTFRRIIGITAAVMLVLISLTVIASNQATIATRERNNAITAQANEADARQVAQTREAEAQTAATAEATARLMAEDRRAAAVAAQETAVAERDLANSRILANDAQNIMDTDPQLALLLALEAQKTSDTQEAANVIIQTPRNFIPIESLVRSRHGELGQVAWRPGTTQFAYIESIDRDNPFSEDVNVRIMDFLDRKVVATLRTQAWRLAWNPDGKQLALGGNRLIIWAVDSSSVVTRTIAVAPWGINDLDWSPDGTKIALLPDWADAEVFDATSGEKTAAVSMWTDSGNISWAPDGKAIAISQNDEEHLITVADANSGLEIRKLEGHTDRINHLSWSPDSTRLASASSDLTVRVWDVASGDQVETLQGHTRPVWDVVWSPDGSQLATASSDSTVMIWDSTDGTALHVFRGHYLQVEPEDTTVLAPRGVQSLDWSSDSFRIISSSQQEIIVWDIQNVDPVIALQEHANSVYRVAWNWNGTKIASGSDDRSVVIWDVRSQRAIHELRGPQQSVLSLDWKPNSDLLAAGYGAHGPIDRGATGVRLVTVGAKYPIILWNAEEGKQIASLEEHTGFVSSLSWSPDGSLLASGGAEEAGVVIVWDPIQKKVLRKMQHPFGAVSSVAWSPTTPLLASASADRTVRIWDAQTAEEKMILQHDSEVLDIAWSPDGTRIASVTNLPSLAIWEVSTGKLVHRLDGLAGGSWTVDWSPDGRRVLAASRDTNSIHVWNVVNGDAVVYNPGHSNTILSAVWSPDGQFIASSGIDAVVRLSRTRFLRPPCELAQRNMIWLEWKRYLSRLRPYEATCPNYPLDVDSLLDAGDSAARSSNLESARAQYWLALQTDPQLTLDPVGRANSVLAGQLMEKGDEEALLGNTDGAIALYQEAIKIDANLGPDLIADVRLRWGTELAEKGRNLAVDGEVESAITILGQAVELNPDLGFDPATEAQQSAARGYVQRAEFLVESGNVDKALEFLQRAFDVSPAALKFSVGQLDPSLALAVLLLQRADALVQEGRVSQAIALHEEAEPAFDRLRAIEGFPLAGFMNNMCWHGSLWAEARRSLSFCDLAIAWAATNEEANFRESRGLARALTGDVAGAIEDFEFAVTQSGDPNFVESRTAWIGALREGQDPTIIFDETTLETLRNQ